MLCNKTYESSSTEETTVVWFIQAAAPERTVQRTTVRKSQSIGTLIIGENLPVGIVVSPAYPSDGKIIVSVAVAESISQRVINVLSCRLLGCHGG